MTNQLVYYKESLAEAGAVELLGAKAANLRRLQEFHQNVPPFYVITSHSFRLLMDATGLARRIADRLKAASAGEGHWRAAANEIGGWFQQADLPDQLEQEIRQIHAEVFGPDALCAVRSSVVDEDARQQSFAGMHDTVLGLRNIEKLLVAVKQVWGSAYSERALAYRHNRDISCENLSVAVVVQQLVDSQRSGVMFTCDPASENRHLIVINSVFGFGPQLVSGGAEADMYWVDKRTMNTTVRLAQQSERQVLAGSQLKVVPNVEHPHAHGSLNSAQVRVTAEAGMAIEKWFGRPQDIEFCFDPSGHLFILQSRPVTPMRENGPARGNHLVWDNSNIIESYPGITSPMTFSFIRRVYTIVYHCFAEVMGVAPPIVHANRHVYENMLGLFHGRVYYNLKNWYRSLQLLPGYQYNSGFMESMMGLKESLELEQQAPKPGLVRRWLVEFPALVRLSVRSLWNIYHMQKLVDQFQTNFHLHYDRWAKLDFRDKKPHELAALYKQMEDALLWKWKAPIINDFFVMIFYGVLKRLCGSWCGDESGSLQNDLLCGEGGVESTAPAMLLLKLAKLAQDNPVLRGQILQEPITALPNSIRTDQRYAEFNELMRRYLELYGFRCMNELKLEESSLKEQPHVLYQVIRNYLSLDDPKVLDIGAIAAREQRIRGDAEQRAFASLLHSRSLLPRRTILRWVIKNARLGVKNRENMRFARTRIFGLLREMLCALGAHLAEQRILDDDKDIFYLTIDEAWDFIKGTAVTTDLRGLVKLRRNEFDRYRNHEPAPDERFETYGMAYHRNLLQRQQREDKRAVDGKLRGIGCCPGLVTGPVKIVDGGDNDIRLCGEILVAERTDPGWVPLYPAVSGILIERGSILSHSAVVAREMGIPTIVGITGLVNALTTGQKVRMDGRAGTVEILAGQRHL
jgi:rifampicin phosphotransferase